MRLWAVFVLLHITELRKLSPYEFFYVCLSNRESQLVTQMVTMTHSQRFSVLFLGKVLHFNMVYSLLWKRLQSWTE